MTTSKGWDIWSRLAVPAPVPFWHTTHPNTLHVNMQPYHSFASQVSLKHLCSRSSHLKVQADKVQAAPPWRQKTKVIYSAPQRKSSLVFSLLRFWAEDRGPVQVPSYAHEVLFLCRCPIPLGACTPQTLPLLTRKPPDPLALGVHLCQGAHRNWFLLTRKKSRVSTYLSQNQVLVRGLGQEVWNHTEVYLLIRVLVNGLGKPT